jgi:tetraacyldisaccharide 4'-kinase
MKTPQFWSNRNVKSAILYPASLLYYLAYRGRVWLNKNPYKSKIPVISVGNLIAGGSGKTPICIEIAKFLRSKNKSFCFLSKGYGGHFKNVVKLDKNNSRAETVGDEPLILFNYGDTFIAKNRVKGLEHINSNFDYDYIIMDDGLQNPTFIKDRVVLVVDGNFGFGNGLILPAGPLRDRMKNVYKSIDLAVIIGDDRTGVSRILEKHKVNFIGSKILVKNSDDFDKNTEYVAFCGLGRPEKFKKSLTENGLKIKKFIVFGDHYFYRSKDINDLRKYDCKLITTEKDWVKLDEGDRATVNFLKIETPLDGSRLERALL